MKVLLGMICSILIYLVCYRNFTSGAGICGDKCHLPECYCNVTTTPGGIPGNQTPQFVVVTYTGSVVKSVLTTIKKIFPATRKNPNSCRTRGTIFVTGNVTDYCAVHRLYVTGQEIGVSAEDRDKKYYWWQRASYEEWQKELAEHRETIAEKGKIPPSELVGMRTPPLSIGGDIQFSLLNDHGFQYDASGKADFSTLWPFTLNNIYSKIARCLSGKCPVGVYPGMWEFPVFPLTSTSGDSCYYLDQCFKDLENKREQLVMKLLQENFQRKYSQDRSPLLINLREKSLAMDAITAVLTDFLNDVSNIDDVWVVAIQDVITWVGQPMEIADLSGHPLWDCPPRDFYPSCKLRDNILKDISLGLDPIALVFGQAIILVVSYIFIVCWDRTHDAPDGFDPNY